MAEYYKSGSVSTNTSATSSPELQEPGVLDGEKKKKLLSESGCLCCYVLGKLAGVSGPCVNEIQSDENNRFLKDRDQNNQ
mmetsp:Transcript_6898/g.12357  ORF Transcript_6898/g.12357 Transcript_6898/m.12357 type:complete len:80 (-) Transcript_6898:2726-2965(-)